MPAFDKIALGRYIPAQSPIHALDPRAKIILTIAAMAAIFMTRTAAAFILWGLILLLLARLSKIPPRVVAASARPVLILIIFTSLLHLFMTPGEAAAKIGPLTVTKEGIRLALTMSLRLACLVMYASLLTFTTSPSRISDGLEGLLSPLKRIGVPAHETAMMITIALRFIPTLFEETARIIKAQKSRGAEFDEGGLLKRAKAYIPVLIPLFVIIFRRAESLASAMEARGYNGGAGRSRMKPLCWRAADSAALAAFAAIAVLIIAGERLLPL
ncbi:MAG: energy-coupling factor transporter transmembrane component T [Synergistaceae bacterium]|nr:energy-coupling factor transporter transmembrane component T [Synergistaceae bacterium]